jgi:hypothetical protein
MPKAKRIFLVCKSKNCLEAKRAGVRCIISMMPTATGSALNYARSLNNRKFCTLYTIPALLKSTNTPNWQVSVDKPGLRKQLQKAKEAEVSFYVDNPDFLEV